MIEGHNECAKYLENAVGDLLLSYPILDEKAQNTLFFYVFLNFLQNNSTPPGPLLGKCEGGGRRTPGLYGNTLT